MTQQDGLMITKEASGEYHVTADNYVRQGYDILQVVGSVLPDLQGHSVFAHIDSSVEDSKLVRKIFNLYNEALCPLNELTPAGNLFELEFSKGSSPHQEVGEGQYSLSYSRKSTEDDPHNSQSILCESSHDTFKELLNRLFEDWEAYGLQDKQAIHAVFDGRFDKHERDLISEIIYLHNRSRKLYVNKTIG